jgi:hypothetical protein
MSDGISEGLPEGMSEGTSEGESEGVSEGESDGNSVSATAPQHRRAKMTRVATRGILIIMMSRVLLSLFVESVAWCGVVWCGVVCVKDALAQFCEMQILFCASEKKEENSTAHF